MPLEDSITKWKKEIDEVLQENIDISDEGWFKELTFVRTRLETVERLLEK